MHPRLLRRSRGPAGGAGARPPIPSVVTCDSGEFVSIPGINYGSQRTRAAAAVREACTLAHECTCARFHGRLGAEHVVLAER